MSHGGTLDNGRGNLPNTPEHRLETGNRLALMPEAGVTPHSLSSPISSMLVIFHRPSTGSTISSAVY